MRVALLLVALWAGGHAFAVDCARTAVVTAQGFGVIGLPSEAQLGSAVSDALANALAQATGGFLQSTRSVRNSVYRVVEDGVTTTEREREVVRSVESRLAGTFTSVEILARHTVAEGVEAVTVRATVCLDQRIVLAIDGDPNAVRSLSGAVREGTSALGWQLLATHLRFPASDEEQILDLALSTGASVVGIGRIGVYPQTGVGDTRAILAVLDVTLVDARTSSVLFSADLVGQGIGFTDASARQDAISKMAIEFSRILTTRFLDSEHRPVRIIVVHNVRRANSRYTLIDLLERINGVIRVTDSRYDEGRAAVVLEVELTGDLCRIADELGRDRRIVMRVDSCGSGSAELTVTRE
jgi:hypothetical protein